MWAHWRHLANTMELVLPLPHPSPQPKRQIDRFIRYCTARGRKSLYFTMGVPFPKIAGPFSWVTAECPYTLQWDAPPPLKIAHSIMPALCSLCNCVLSFFLSVLCSLRLPVIIKVSSYLMLFPWGDLNAHLIHGYLDPPESSIQTASRSVYPSLQGSLVCKPTD